MYYQKQNQNSQMEWTELFSLIADIFGIINLFLNLEHKENQKILEELQHQDKDYLQDIRNDIKELKEKIGE